MTKLITRIDLQPDVQDSALLLLLARLKADLSERLQFTRGKNSVLFHYPSGMDTIRLAEVLEKLPSELKAIVKRINLFEDADEEVLHEGQRAAQHG